MMLTWCRRGLPSAQLVVQEVWQGLQQQVEQRVLTRRLSSSSSSSSWWGCRQQQELGHGGRCCHRYHQWRLR
jgi:hypothetical protein